MPFENMKVAMLVANGFEESEMLAPKKALEEKNIEVSIISPEKDKVKSWKDKNWGGEFPVDVALDEAKPDNYDALVLPGGVMNPDKLRMNEKAVNFVKSFVESKKPIAAICHGPWTLINANGIKNHKLTSWASLKADIENAGGHWVDEEVVRDKQLVTSRKPDDLPAFNKKLLEMLAEIAE